MFKIDLDLSTSENLLVSKEFIWFTISKSQLLTFPFISDFNPKKSADLASLSTFSPVIKSPFFTKLLVFPLNERWIKNCGSKFRIKSSDKFIELNFLPINQPSLSKLS